MMSRSRSVRSSVSIATFARTVRSPRPSRRHPDAGRAVNEPGGRKVGAGNFFHQLRNGHLRDFQQQEQPLDDFAQIVRGNVGRIADGDPRPRR